MSAHPFYGVGADDARVRDAAPELLAALVAAFGEPDGSALSNKAGEAAIYAARAAIARATAS